MRDKSNKKDNPKTSTIVMAIILVGVLLGGGIYLMNSWSTLFPPPTPSSTVKLTSTFTLIDYNTGEDVSAWVEVSVWTPDEDNLPFDDEDPYTLTNFDEEEKTTDAEDVAIDLRDHDVFWLEIDPGFESDYGGYNGVDNALTTRDFRKGFGGTNYDYTVYVYHAPTNVSIAMLGNGDMDGTGFPYLGDAQPYNNTWHPSSIGVERGTSGTWTVYLNMPKESVLGYHAGDTDGDEYDIDADELADIIADGDEHDYDIDYDLLWLQDQSNFRTIAPYYDLTDDAEDDFSDDLEQLTNAFAIKFRMNESISMSDGDNNQVNFTIMERDSNKIHADIVFDVDIIWIIFYDPITCYDGDFNFDVRIEFGSGIFLNLVTTNRLPVPEDENNLGTPVLLNTMVLDLHA